MVRRCTLPTGRQFADYGGRGISVCERWLHSFENFLADMGECPPGLTIERDENDGDYEPGNCRWIAAHLQARNRRSTVVLTCQGETMILADWAQKTGIRQHTIRRRLMAGWSIEEALAPVRRRRLTAK